MPIAELSPRSTQTAGIAFARAGSYNRRSTLGSYVDGPFTYR